MMEAGSVCRDPLHGLLTKCYNYIDRERLARPASAWLYSHTWEDEAGELPRVQSWLALHSKTQFSQGYIERPYFNQSINQHQSINQKLNLSTKYN